jgi:hypothetical protein
MSWTHSFNFRRTVEHATDVGPIQTYVISEPTPDLYPVTRNGVTFGFTTTSENTSGSNRGGASDPRTAGVHSNVTAFGTSVFKIDLPAAGQYIMKACIGEIVYDRPDGIIAFLDNTTPLFSLDHATGFTTGSQKIRDITDVLHTEATWLAANGGASRTETFASTILNVHLGTTRPGFIAHLYLDQVETGAAALIGTALLSLGATATLAAAVTAGRIFRSRVIA